VPAPVPGVSSEGSAAGDTAAHASVSGGGGGGGYGGNGGGSGGGSGGRGGLSVSDKVMAGLFDNDDDDEVNGAHRAAAATANPHGPPYCDPDLDAMLAVAYARPVRRRPEGVGVGVDVGRRGPLATRVSPDPAAPGGAWAAADGGGDSSSLVFMSPSVDDVCAVDSLIRGDGEGAASAGAGAGAWAGSAADAVRAILAAAAAAGPSLLHLHAPLPSAATSAPAPAAASEPSLLSAEPLLSAALRDLRAQAAGDHDQVPPSSLI